MCCPAPNPRTTRPPPRSAGRRRSRRSPRRPNRGPRDLLVVKRTGAADRIREAVSSWDGVDVAPHRFGGIEFRLGRRELGHLHGDRIADLPFPKRIRDELIAEGRARPHHVLPDTGWVTVPIASG